mgnify:CR=1 FL=1
MPLIRVSACSREKPLSPSELAPGEVDAVEVPWERVQALRDALDRPACNLWLHRLPGARFHWHFELQPRTGQLAGWTAPLYPLRDGTAIILRILRESGKPQSLSAPLGTFQQMLGGKTAQMLRVRLEPGLPCVPEISANKYVLNIRFLAQNGEDARARTADWDVGFELTFCNL